LKVDAFILLYVSNEIVFRYFATLTEKYYKHIFIIALFIYVFLVPIGYQSIELLGDDVRTNQIQDTDEVLSVSSLKSDLIFLVDSEEDLLTEKFSIWADHFALDIERDPTIQNFTADAASVSHIFAETRKILSPYLSSVSFATAYSNLTSYLIVNGTQLVLDQWEIEFGTNQTDSLARAIINSTSMLNSVVDDYSLGLTFLSKQECETSGIDRSFCLDTIKNWISALGEFLEDKTYSSNIYEIILENWKSNPDQWIREMPEFLHSMFSFYLEQISIDSQWTAEFVFSTTASFLFGEENLDAITFLEDLFHGGDLQYFTLLTQDELIPFLRREYIPYGFPDKVRDFYLTTFTNSNGTSPVTSMVFRIKLRPDLTTNEIEAALDYTLFLAENFSKSNDLGLDVVFLSQLNYQRERSNQLAEEFHRIDLLAILFGSIILFLWMRDIVLVFLVLSLSWSTTQVIRGVILLTVPDSILLIDASLSMGSTIVLGAALNYCVFFAFRYQEEVKTKPKVEAIQVAIRTAIHSIFISGMAIFLTFLPLVTSDASLLKGLAWTAVFGIFLTVILLSTILPALFMVFKGAFGKYLFVVPKIIKFKRMSIGITPAHHKRIISVFVLLSLISIWMISSANPSLTTSDLISEEGETGEAIAILEEKYPANFFSKLLIRIEFNESLYINEKIKDQVLTPMLSLSNAINNTKGISDVLSIAWPLGKYFNYSDDSIGVVPYETASVISDQLIVRATNTTYLIAVFSVSASEGTIIDGTGKIVASVVDLVDSTPIITDGKVSGLPAETYGVSSSVSRQLPIQFLLALFFLIGFLGFQYKSISVPIRLVITILIGSILAIAIGSVIWQLIFDSSLNVIISAASIIVLLGLGTDFDVLIYNRIKEEETTAQSFPEAISVALEKSAPAIRTSGLVMATTFLALLGSNLRVVQQFGLISCIAILLDIFLIRTLLVPAFLLIRYPVEHNK
jgi:predicted RND superfamily exporter protein